MTIQILIKTEVEMQAFMTTEIENGQLVELVLFEQTKFLCLGQLLLLCLFATHSLLAY